MKKISLLCFLIALVGGISAQLTNNGGTITVQSGAKLVVTGDITNATGGVINNNGIIEVEGDFVNNNILTSGAASEIVFKGATDSDFTTNGSSLAIVRNQKTAGDVILLDDLIVNETVDFSGTSNIVIGNNEVILKAGSTSNGSSSTGWFETNNLGTVSKEITTLATTTFQVGDATNYTPLTITPTAGTIIATSTIAARVTPSVHPNKPADADAFITRYWTADATDIAGYNADMTGTFAASDVNGTPANIKGARYENAEFQFLNGTGNATTVSAPTTENSSELTGMNFFGKANITVFLEGPYNNAGAMTNGINSQIPLQSPYDSKLATTIPSNAVDWIKVEIRETAAQNVVVSSQSGFLLTNGSIVDIDGTTPLLLKNASATSHIAIKHRNHLGIMSANAINLNTSVPTANFADGSTVAYTNGADAMYTESDGKLTLFGGDGNGSGNVSASDFVLIFKPSNGQPFDYLTTGRADFNLNGGISASDFVLIFKKNNSKLQQIPN